MGFQPRIFEVILYAGKNMGIMTTLKKTYCRKGSFPRGMLRWVQEVLGTCYPTTFKANSLNCQMRLPWRTVYHYRQDGTFTANVPLTSRLLPPLSGTGQLGRASAVGAGSFLALGAIQALCQVADRSLKRFYCRLQGRFPLHKPLVVRPPGISLPPDGDIGRLHQHHGLLGKGRYAIPVHRHHLASGVHLGSGMFHGLRYTRFFWKVPFF